MNQFTSNLAMSVTALVVALTSAAALAAAFAAGLKCVCSPGGFGFVRFHGAAGDVCFALLAIVHSCIVIPCEPCHQ